MIEVILTLTCWMVFLPSGEITCYCQEDEPVIEQSVQVKGDNLTERHSWAGRSEY